MSVSIKDIDEKAFRSLKAEAAKAGMKVGDAASEAFRMWVISKRLGRLRDKDRMLSSQTNGYSQKCDEDQMVWRGGDSQMERPEEVVLDASVALKWFSEEDGTDRAVSLRDEHI